MIFPSSVHAHDSDTPPKRRWLVPAIASLLLHVLAIEWMSGNVQAPSWQPPREQVVTAILASAATKNAAPKPAPQEAAPKRKPRPKPPAAKPPIPEVEAPAPDIVAIEPSGAIETSAINTEPAASISGIGNIETPAEPVSVTANENNKAQYRINPPPPVVLQYDVQKVVRDGNPTYGRGKISWQVDGDRYVIDGEAGVLFITALTFKSEGMLDGHGLAPVLYSEKRFRRPETNTHFQRERNTISFSASTQSYPRQGGEQDRISVIWQLAGIGRGDNAAFAPGAEIDIFVAGVRNGEVWRIQVIGEEEIDLDGIRTRAWHVIRIPRPGSYDQKLDIWFAPQFEWYPVRIRYTETNGDYLDMSVSNLKLANSN